MDTTNEPEINYPCEWNYKCIVLGGVDLAQIASSLIAQTHQIRKSANSKAGKYTSYNLTTNVQNDAQRREIFDKLKSHADIKFVL